MQTWWLLFVRYLQVDVLVALALVLLVSRIDPAAHGGSRETDLAELALFLCSEAAQNVRGVAWQMDGGWTAQ